MKPILYYAADCPDTAPFVAELKRLGVDYEAVEVLSSIPNLNQWSATLLWITLSRSYCTTGRSRNLPRPSGLLVMGT